MTSPPSATVLMTADTVGGVWHYALQLARGLAARDIATVLATMGRAPSAAQRAAAASVPGLVHVHADHRLEWMPDAMEDVARSAEWLLRLERAHAPDIIHLNGYCHAVAPFAAPKLVVAHSCVRSWWRAVLGGDPPAEWAAYGRAVAAGLQAADAVVAPTAAFRRMLEDLYGALPAARVIHNGRDPADFSPVAAEPFVLTAGRLWDRAKNVAALDAVAPSLPWPVLVAGDDSGPDGRAEIGRNLRPLGLLAPAELAQWMGRAAVFALPARYEPFGLAVLEAALSGCALVLGDIPTFRELWDDAALFVPPDDHAALRGALARLADDPALTASLAAAARRRAQRYGAARMVDTVVDLYGALGLPPRADRPSRRDSALCAS